MKTRVGVNEFQMEENSVRLVHLQRPRSIADKCDQCGGSFDQPTHWRIRGYTKAKDAAMGTSIVAHTCSEKCARIIYDQLRVEIALITGQKPSVKTYRQGRKLGG